MGPGPDPTNSITYSKGMTERELRTMIAQRVRGRRKRQGLTIAQLAERSDLNDDYLGRIEHGSKMPSLPVLLKVASGLGIGLEELLRGAEGLDEAEDTTSKKLQAFVRGLTKAQRADALGILTKLRSSERLHALRVALGA